MRNEDLNIIKWQLKLMSLLPSGPNAKGRAVDDLCKELRRIETGDLGPDKARDDPFGKALIRRIQKALTALAQDEQWGSEIECQIAGSSGTLEKIHPDDGGTAKKFWKWKGKTRRLMVPPPGADEALALLLLEERLKTELPPAIRDCLRQYIDNAKTTLNNLGRGSQHHKWQRKIAHVSPNQPLRPATIRQDVYEDVLRALYEDLQLRVSYRKRGSETPEKYRIHPLGLLLRGPVTYLVCTINDYDNPVMLALHRFLWARLADQKSSTPRGFTLQGYVEAGGGEFPTGEPGSGQFIRLDAEFTSRVGQHLKETPLEKDQILTNLDDERTHLLATVRDTQQLRWWLLAFGPRVKVSAPPELRHWIANEHRTAARLYAEGEPLKKTS